MERSMRLNSAAAASILSVAGAAVPVLGQWAPAYSIERIGLYGPEYVGIGAEQSVGGRLNGPGGLVSGYSTRSPRSNIASNGIDTWIWTPEQGTVQVGLTTPAHMGSEGFRSSIIVPARGTAVASGRSWRVTGVRTLNGEDCWAWSADTGVTQIGFWGPGFIGSDGYQLSNLQGQTEAGFAYGWSNRISGVSSVIGRESWVWSPATGTVAVGLNRPEHINARGARYDTIVNLSPGGRAIGHSTRTGTATGGGGFDAWVWEPGQGTMQIGPNGPEYTSPTGYRTILPWTQNASGQVIGSARRVDSFGADMGQDGWIWTRAGGAQRMGLDDPVHIRSDGYRQQRIASITDSGLLIGGAARYSEDGQTIGLTCWVWEPNTGYVLIGLTGPEYTGPDGYRYSDAVHNNASGVVVGVSTRSGVPGAATVRRPWVWVPGVGTRELGLFGPEHTRDDGLQTSEVYRVDESGGVWGSSRRYPETDERDNTNYWYWSPDGRTHVVGLTDAAHTGPNGEQYHEGRSSGVGWSTGTSKRYVNAVNWWGDAWLWTPQTGTIELGLTGPLYQTAEGVRRSIQQPNYQSVVPERTLPRAIGGMSVCIACGGELVNTDVWYYDTQTGVTHNVTASVPGASRPSDGARSARAEVMTRDGYQLGTYTWFDPVTEAPSPRAFAFRPDVGFVDLEELIPGGLAVNGWASLDTPSFEASMEFIVGAGRRIDGAVGSSAYLMRPIPAPVCPADVTGDRTVDGADFVAFVNSFSLGDAATDAAADFNRDGTIDGGDFVAFMAAFAAGC